MKSEAQPLRITADAKPAKPWFVTWGLGCSPQAYHISDRYFEVRNAEEHEKSLVRIVTVHSGLNGGSLKPSLRALAKRMELPTEHLLQEQSRFRSVGHPDFDV